MAVETIKFPTNIPVELCLKFDSGLECQSQFNGADQVMFTCDDDRRFYVAPAVAREIEKAGVRRGVPFTMCKREKKVGQRTTTFMEVKRLDEDIPDEEAAQPPQAFTAPSSSAAPERGRAAENQQASFESNLVAGLKANGHANGNGASANAPQAQLLCSLLQQTGLGVVDAVARVEAHARELLGSDFQFGAENIQKLWATAFINLTQQGGRR